MWDLIFQKENLMYLQRIQSHIMICRSGPTDSKGWDKKRNRYVDSHITVFAFCIVWCGFWNNMQIVMWIWKTMILMNPFVFVYKTEIAVGIMFRKFGAKKLNMCYSGGREISKITSGRHLLKYAKREESINRVPHPCYLPLALLRIWVDLDWSGSISLDLGLFAKSGLI